MSNINLNNELHLFCECGAPETPGSINDSDWLKFECGAEFEPDRYGGEWEQIAPCELKW